MPLSVAYRSQGQMEVIQPGEPVAARRQKSKSIYTIAREERFKKAALKKYADRIKAIQEYYPNWQPEF